MNTHEQDAYTPIPTALELLWPAFQAFTEYGSHPMTVDRSDQLVADRLKVGHGQGWTDLSPEERELLRRRMRQVRTDLKLTGLLHNPERAQWALVEGDVPHPQTEEELQERFREARRAHTQDRTRKRREQEHSLETAPHSEANSAEIIDQSQAAADQDPLLRYALDRAGRLRSDYSGLVGEHYRLRRELEECREQTEAVENEFRKLAENLELRGIAVPPLEDLSTTT